MIKFANSEFIFAIRGPKLAWESVQDKFSKHKIGGFFFYLHPWNDLEWSNEGANSPRPINLGYVLTFNPYHKAVEGIKRKFLCLVRIGNELSIF